MFQAALQKQQQADATVQGTLESNSFNSGEQVVAVAASAAGPLCAASPPMGDEVPTVNGGQSDSYSESMDREPEPEPAEEVSENGPLLGSWAVDVFMWWKHQTLVVELRRKNVHFAYLQQITLG